MCKYCEDGDPTIPKTGVCRYCGRVLCKNCRSEIDKNAHGLCRVKKLASGVRTRSVKGVKPNVGFPVRVKPGVKPDVGVKLSEKRGGMSGIR